MVQGKAAHRTNTQRRSHSGFFPAAMVVVTVMIIFCALLTAGFTFYPEWMRLSSMRRDLAKEKSRLEELQKLADDRSLELHLLQTDTEYLEIIARDRLDLMKEGETIFRLSSNAGHTHF